MQTRQRPWEREQRQRDYSSAIGANSVASGEGAVALGESSVATGKNSVAIGKGSAAERPNTVSVGNSQKGVRRQITNVADGTEPYDAVNLRQLNRSTEELKAYTRRKVAIMGAMNAAMTNSAAAAAAALNRGMKNSVAIGLGAYKEYGAVSCTYARQWSERVRSLISLSGNNGEGLAIGVGLSLGW